MTQRSILILNDEWGTAKGGISTVNRQVAALARQAGLNVYAPVLTASEADKEDAHEKQINLILPRIKDHLADKEPKLDWLLCHETFYPRLNHIPDPEIIVGHAPITMDAAVDLKENAFPNAKLFMFNHVISEDIEVHKQNWKVERVAEREKHAFETAAKADRIFSVGPRMFEHYSNKYRAFTMRPEEVPHDQFAPFPDDQFFKTEFTQVQRAKNKQVITFGRIKGVEKLKGYDLVAKAMSKIAELFHNMDEPIPSWVVRGVPKGEETETKKVLQEYITCKHLNFHCYTYGTQDDIRTDLQQSHLCIMASRTEPFGLVGFEAMATGIPVLISKHSGLAQYVREEFPELADSVIVDVGLNDCSIAKDIETWYKAISKVLNKYNAALKKANIIKDGLRNSTIVKESQERFKHLCME